MSARFTVCSMSLHEKHRFPRRLGVAAPIGRRTCFRGILHRGGCRLPRRRPAQCAALAGGFPAAWRRGPGGESRPRPAGQTVGQPGEDHPPLAQRLSDRARLPDRAVDRRTARPTHRAGMGHSPSPPLPGDLAAAAGVHPPEAAAGEPRAQRRSGRPLARPGLAAHQKKARRCGACLLWMDESGLLMAPLVRRSWAVRGQPPEQEQKAGHREKVAVAAALWLPPARDRLHLAYRTLVNGYFTNLEVAEFLLCAVEGLPDPVIAMWDCGNMHKGPPIRELVDQAQGRLAIESVPPYSPELMPVEFLWSWLKYGRLCNFAPRDAARLNEVIAGELDPIQEDQELLQSFFHRSALRLPRTLLS